MRLRIAIRNTFRNKRRTALNVFMIASGVTSLVLFRGFSYQMLRDVREGMIHSDIGHLQVAQNSLWQQTAENPKDNLIPSYSALLERTRANPSVEAAAGRITFFGLVGSRDKSVAAQVLSIDPAFEKERMKQVNLIQGKALDSNSGQRMLLGAGLARSIRAKLGDSLNLLGYTYDGVVNAFDMEVSGIFQSGMSEIDNTTALVTLNMAQKLLDTDSVEKIVVYLKDTDHTDRAQHELSSNVFSATPTLKAKNWVELATIYHDLSEFYKVYDGVIEVIILCLVLIGILNTVGMSIFERTGEIGTMRALGETERNVVSQFILEGAVLGFFGGLTGVVSGIIIASILNAIEIPLTLPLASLPIPLKIALPFSIFIQAIILILVTSVVAAAIPALRATRLNIVDALRRNI